MDELNLEEDSPNQSIIIESVLSHFASYLSAYQALTARSTSRQTLKIKTT